LLAAVVTNAHVCKSPLLLIGANFVHDNRVRRVVD